MQDFIYNLMHPLPNGIMTVIVAILTIFWIFTLLGGMDMDAIDIGGDVDVDADIDADIGSPSAVSEFLSFLNIGRVPFMLVVTVFMLIIWIGSLIITGVINIEFLGSLSALILIPLAIVSIFLTKLTTAPMAKFFDKIGYRGEEEIDFLGRSGKMTSTIAKDKVGTAEFVVDKNPIRLNVRSIDGEELKYGDYIIIADETPDRKVYLVSKEISLRNI
ncbi:OB-fold-containig protein [Dysgonomonas massiliensis]|uniref:OB-fold-containig protein n=1 Tax=Dysgonomonas massiliensis TaxID=2040292 RepID=UPI000C75BAF0|nr:OB-fold-containig protein [Dysgonomonas massiliensis]